MLSCYNAGWVSFFFDFLFDFHTRPVTSDHVSPTTHAVGDQCKTEIVCVCACCRASTRRSRGVASAGRVPRQAHVLRGRRQGGQVARAHAQGGLHALLAHQGGEPEGGACCCCLLLLPAAAVAAAYARQPRAPSLFARRVLRDVRARRARARDIRTPRQAHLRGASRGIAPRGIARHRSAGHRHSGGSAVRV